MKLIKLCLCAIIGIGVSACGQTGPLVLADNEQVHKKEYAED